MTYYIIYYSVRAYKIRTLYFTHPISPHVCDLKTEVEL